MKIYDNYSKIINLTIAFIIVAIVTLLIKNYFRPFFMVIIFVIITQPINLLATKLNFPKGISAIIALLIINFSLFIIIYYFGNTLINLANKFYINNYSQITSLINNMKIWFGLDLNKITKSISSFLNGALIMQSAAITSDGIVSYFLANITTYFFLVDRKKIIELMMCIFPMKSIKSIKSKNRNLKEVLKIEIKLILLSAIIVTIGFKILGISNSIFLGALCAILDILPFVGTTIVFIPIIIYNIIIKKYLIVIGIVGLYLLERFTREILEAKFLSSKLEIHPLIVMLSIYIGVKMFGFIGVIAGPIYSIIAKDIIYDE